jgi:hypothetical protein
MLVACRCAEEADAQPAAAAPAPKPAAEPEKQLSKKVSTLCCRMAASSPAAGVLYVTEPINHGWGTVVPFYQQSLCMMLTAFQSLTM